MDQTSFDRIARLLGGAATRRQGIAAALGGMLGGVAGAAPAAEARPNDGKGKRGRSRPEPEGPCGDGSRKANVCDRDSDCCTRICQLRKNPKKNAKDGRGRCRCIRLGGACQQDRNCCNSPCIAGVCGFLPPAELGAPCNSEKQQTCATPGAVCRPYQGAGVPAGEYCTLSLRSTCQAGGACVSDACDFPNNGSGGVEQEPVCCGRPGTSCTSNSECCAGAVCSGGACADETCDVCAQGCPYTTIKDAVDNAAAGAVIRVAPGTYGGAANATVVMRDVTIRRCGTSGSVIWQGVPAPQDAMPGALGLPNSYYINPEPVPTVKLTLAHLDFRGPSSRRLVQVESPPTDGGTNTMRLLGCTFSRQQANGAVEIRSTDLVAVRSRWFDNVYGSTGASVYQVAGTSTALFDRCEFYRNHATGDHRSSGVSLRESVVTIRDSVFDRNGRCDTSTTNGGAILAGSQSTLSIERTQITNNCGNRGGGIYFSGDGLVVDAASTITGNACRPGNEGAGIYCSRGDSCASLINGVSSANVYGNDAAAGDCAESGGGIVSCDSW